MQIRMTIIRLSSAMYRPGLLPDSDPGLCAVDKQNLHYQYTTAYHYNKGIDRFHKTEFKIRDREWYNVKTYQCGIH
jgi:hypothetical protein